jgi:hypothetical protein
MPRWVKAIPTAPIRPGSNIALTEYGYGVISENGPTSNYLKKSDQGSIVVAACPTIKGQPLKSGHICTKVSSSYPLGGDSGGPLVWWVNGYWQQVGTFSLYPTDPHDKEWRIYWSESDVTTRNWILSYVFSTLGSNGLNRGAPPSDGAILRDRQSGARWQYTGSYRYAISDDATYNCLVENGKPVVELSRLTIEALPQMVGSHASCTRQSPTATPQPTATTGPTSPTATPGSTPPTPTSTTAPVQHNPVDAYSNYGQSNLAGHAMCRGNPGNPLSMPGGVATQTFTVQGGVASLNSAMIQVDPASVTAHLSVSVNGNVVATTAADAVGDTHFNFGPVSVHPGDEVTLRIEFTATYGKIITLYTVGNPGGHFSARNSCPDGAPNFDSTTSGLRAVVSGLS